MQKLLKYFTSIRAVFSYAFFKLFVNTNEGKILSLFSQSGILCLIQNSGYPIHLFKLFYNENGKKFHLSMSRMR